MYNHNLKYGKKKKKKKKLIQFKRKIQGYTANVKTNVSMSSLKTSNEFINPAARST